MHACDIDMRFTFVHAGWKAAANDSWIVEDVLYNPKWNLPHAPPGEFYIKNHHYSYLFQILFLSFITF